MVVDGADGAEQAEAGCRCYAYAMSGGGSFLMSSFRRLKKHTASKMALKKPKTSALQSLSVR